MSRVRRPLRRRDHDRMAGQAWDAFVALVKAEHASPGLMSNPYWCALKDTAHARFRAIFESEVQK